MGRPHVVRVLQSLHLDPALANRAYYDVDAVVVAGKRALVVVGACVRGAVNFLAAVALEGQEVLLVAQRKLAMLTNVSKFHVIF